MTSVSMDGLRLGLLGEFNAAARLVKDMKNRLSDVDYERLSEQMEQLGCQIGALLCVYNLDMEDFSCLHGNPRVKFDDDIVD